MNQMFLNSKKSKRILKEIMKFLADSQNYSNEFDFNQCPEDNSSFENVSIPSKICHTKYIKKKVKKNRRSSLKHLTLTKHDDSSHMNSCADGLNPVEGVETQATLQIGNKDQKYMLDEEKEAEKKVRRVQNSNYGKNSEVLTDKLNQYYEEIYQHLMDNQSAYIPLPVQESKQKNEAIRSKMVDWLFNIAKVLNFRMETAFLAINIVDRTLSQLACEKKKLQLLGITSLFIAAKYEQIMIPKLSYFSAIAAEDIRVSARNILQLEGTIITLLNFDFGYISPLLFVNLICQRFGISTVDRETTLEQVKKIMCIPECKVWSSSKLAWFALSRTIPTSHLIHQYIKDNEALSYCYQTGVSLK